MAYTKPSATAVNFTLGSGYSKPGTTAVDFTLGDGTTAGDRELHIASSTEALFISASVANIQGATALSLVWQSYNHVVATIAGSSTPNFERYYPVPVQGGTTATFVGRTIVDVKPKVAGITTASFIGLFEKPMVLSAAGKGRVTGVMRYIATGAVSVSGNTQTSFLLRAVKPSTVNAQGAGAVSGRGGTVIGVQLSSAGASTLLSYGEKLRAGTASITGAGAFSPQSAYSTIAFVPYNATYDTIFVRQKQNKVVAYG